MKVSNVNLFSNVYVVSDDADSKIADENFRKRVLDPAALGIMKKNGNPMTKLQEDIWMNTLRCSAAGGEFTYGIIREDGEIVVVNDCMRSECPKYGACSSDITYRRRYRYREIRWI